MRIELGHGSASGYDTQRPAAGHRRRDVADSFIASLIAQASRDQDFPGLNIARDVQPDADHEFALVDGERLVGALLVKIYRGWRWWMNL